MNMFQSAEMYLVRSISFSVTFIGLKLFFDGFPSDIGFFPGWAYVLVMFILSVVLYFFACIGAEAVIRKIKARKKNRKGIES